MNWDEWSERLSSLVGLGVKDRRILLLPLHDKHELTSDEAGDLKNAVHLSIFNGTVSASRQLRMLAQRPAKYYLPILYLSAWIVRTSDNSRAFWAPFNRAVIRGALEPGTIQQTIAPLITKLWFKAHQDLKIYRPQEGYAHIKWPQAHAGLPSAETDLIADAIMQNVNTSEEPPDELYMEPLEFLGLLRSWLRFEVHVPIRLSRILY
jgi:hypothetical protein